MFRNTARRTASLAFALAAALSTTALALPPGNGNDWPPEPPELPPTAKLSVSPNPALAGTQLVIANTAAFPGGGVKGQFGGDLVTFDASASNDPDGTIVKYEFDRDGNGTYEVSGAEATSSRRYTQTGTFTVKARVTDDSGRKDTVSKQLIVHRAPVARLKATPEVALVGQQIALDGTASTDDNGIAKHELDTDGDGTYETVASTGSVSFTTLGERTLRLRVTDVHGATSTASVKVTVHRAPTAAFTAGPAPVLTDDVVTFDAGGSTDDEPITRYEWDLDGDGTFETDGQASPTTTQAYSTAGAVTVRLRVTDSRGVQDVVAQTITVQPRPVDATAPVVTITPGRTKLGKRGGVKLTVACPAGESRCDGRLDLRSLMGARSAALGGKLFALAGGETARLTIRLSKANRKAIRRAKRLRAEAVAVAVDAAGNTGTATKAVTIRR